MRKDIEEKILKLLENGETLQSSIYKALSVSKSRVSEVLKDLEERNVIKRHKIGKNYLISLSSYVKVNEKSLTIGIIRSSEYGYIIPLKKILKERSVKLKIKVYDSGISIMKDLVMGRLDFGISPAISQIFFAYAGFPVKIIAPAGSGGGYLFSNVSGEKPKALSSRLSTMEMILRTAINSSIIRDPAQVNYFDDPREAIDDYLKGRANAITVWEPFAGILRAEGMREAYNYSEMEHYCCTLSAHSSLKGNIIERFKKDFYKSLNLYEKNRGSYAFAYSALLGLPYGLVEGSLNYYRYHHDLDLKVLERQLAYASVTIPNPSILKTIIMES